MAFGVTAFANLFRETVTSTMGNSVSEILNVAGDGQTILAAMDEALVNNTMKRLATLSQFTKEAYVNVQTPEELERFSKETADKIRKKAKEDGVELTDEEVKKLQTQMISAQNTFSIAKSIEDKVDFYNNEIKGKEDRFNASELQRFTPHQEEIGFVESYRNNRGNIRMARAAISEMQTYAQAQNALLHFLAKTKLISGKTAEFFNDMATVIDFFEPMSQTAADKFRMANYNWKGLAEQYEGLSVDQKKMAAYFMTQRQGGWNEYLGLGANSLHSGVGSVVGNILQFRTLLMREMFEEVSLNLLKAYRDDETIDIQRTAQPTNASSLVTKDRFFDWNARDFFDVNYGIKYEGDIDKSLASINKSMLVDGVLQAAKTRAVSESDLRGWGLLESNREFLHLMIKLRADLHPAVANRWDGDAGGKDLVSGLRSSAYKNEENGNTRDWRAKDTAISETGSEVFTHDMQHTFSFWNEHFAKSIINVFAPLKTGDNPKSLMEQFFSIIEIKGLTTSRDEFLVTNGYKAYDKVPDILLLPTAHRPRIKGSRKESDKLYYEILKDLPPLPEFSEDEKTRGKQREYFDKIKKIHKEFKENSKLDAEKTGNLQSSLLDKKISHGGIDDIADEISKTTIAEKRTKKFYNEPVRQEAIDAYRSTLQGISEMKGGFMARGRKALSESSISTPSKTSLVGNMIHRLNKAIVRADEKLDDNKWNVRAGATKYSAKFIKFTLKLVLPVAIGGTIIHFFPPAAPYIFGVAGAAVITPVGKKIFGALHGSTVSRMVGRAVGAVVGFAGAYAGYEHVKSDIKEIDTNKNKIENFIKTKPKVMQIDSITEHWDNIVKAGDTVVLNGKMVVPTVDSKLNMEAGDQVFYQEKKPGDFTVLSANSKPAGTQIVLESAQEVRINLWLTKPKISDKERTYRFPEDRNFVERLTDNSTPERAK